MATTLDAMSEGCPEPETWSGRKLPDVKSRMEGSPIDEPNRLHHQEAGNDKPAYATVM